MPQPTGASPGPTPVRADLTPFITYLRRLPFVTSVITILVLAIYILQLLYPSLRSFLALDPAALTTGSWWLQLHRLNTYPLTHLGLLHVLANLFAFVPLSERFERFQGSVRWAGLALGPLVVGPGVLYVVLEGFILPGSGTTKVVGLSSLVLTLFTIVAVNTSRTMTQIPFPIARGAGLKTVLSPVVLVVVYFIVAPGASFVGHVCGVVFGYLYGFGWMRRVEPGEELVGKVEEVGKRLGVLGQEGWAGRLGWVAVESSGRGRGEEEGTLPTSFGGAGAGGAGGWGFGGAQGQQHQQPQQQQPRQTFEGVGRPLGS